MDKNKLIYKINLLLINEYGIPERAKELPDPLDLLIATILSQNTNDNNSYKAYVNLRSYILDYSDILVMPSEKLEELIRPAGLTKQKAKAIKNIILKLKAMNNNINLEFIKSLDNNSIIEFLTDNEGIGVKTASCVLLFSLDRDVCPVDTHVHRIVNRLGIVNSKTAEGTYYKLNEKFPPKIAHSFHTNLIKHGRKICRPKNPFCGNCVLKKYCNYINKNDNRTNIFSEERLLLLDKI